MAALNVADGEGWGGHERRILQVSRIKEERSPDDSISGIVVLREAIDLKRNFVIGKGAERCIKLLAAWLLRGAAPYNCRFPEQN
ncbi:hypothetical protein OWS73_23470 [Burkholderia sp. 1B3(2022)]|uniref:hypothetical protein n=1 Tax=Burkholderia sp. 1B3(2022) TaxID=2997425 RepID=UPI002FCB5660